jgi:hypothetical protein
MKMPIITLEGGSVYVRTDGKCLATSRSTEAILLYAILQRLPDPNEPLGEAVEWESEDGTMRTTDKAMAKNWSPHMNLRVVRRATPDEGAPC